MTTLDILAKVGEHLTDLKLPGILAVLLPGDERIPAAGREKHPDDSLLVFEQPLDNADADKRNQLQQKLPGMTVANVGIYVKPDGPRIEPVPALELHTESVKDSEPWSIKTALVGEAPASLEQQLINWQNTANFHLGNENYWRAEHERMCVEYEKLRASVESPDREFKTVHKITDAQWEQLDAQGWKELVLGDFKSANVHVVLARPKRTDPAPQPEQQVEVEPPAEKPAPLVQPVGPAITIIGLDPDSEPKPTILPTPPPVPTVEPEPTLTPAHVLINAVRERGAQSVIDDMNAALFQELLEQERALGLVTIPDDYWGTTQVVIPVTDPCEMDTEPIGHDWDTKKILPIQISEWE